MDVMLNGRDEPRVLFNYRAQGMKAKAMQLTDPAPFELAPHPTAELFNAREGGGIPTDKAEGFWESANDDVACACCTVIFCCSRRLSLSAVVLLSSSSSDFTVDLYPLLSMTKISPCFSDILFPGQV